MNHFPFDPTPSGMPDSPAALHYMLGALALIRRHGPFPAESFAAAPDHADAVQAAGWLEKHGFLKVVKGHVYCTGTGSDYLNQVEIALDSLSRQFRPKQPKLETPKNAHLN